jgi:hypothetical protein
VYHFNYLSGTIFILAVLSNCQIWRNAQTQVGLLANCRQYGGVGADCGLHPLIHTIAPETSAQDVEKKKAELKTPHFLSLNQDIVARSQ